MKMTDRNILRTSQRKPLKLSNSQQQLLLRLLKSGATEVAERSVTRTSAKLVTVVSLESLDLIIIEDKTLSTPQEWSLRFTPAGMSIARELRRMRFQE